MKYRAEIDVMPLKAILDPQGKAVEKGLNNLGISNTKNIRVGKHISMSLFAENKEEAEEIIKAACEKLLANPNIEYFEYAIFEE